MIGQSVTSSETGEPLLDGVATKLERSSYNPPQQVKELYARCQQDYGIAWRLQHRPFKEFDGRSLLSRTLVDQETFGAYVGAEYIPQHKRWRWHGRKNTARNKLVGILAHMLSAMLFPTVHAQNNEDENDKTTARVARLLIEEHLRKAGYKMKFLYMVLSALVNPAVIAEIEYVQALQTIKERMADGNIKITEAVDVFLSGLNLNIVPIDQFLIADFFVPDIQKQPYIIRVNRIPWDTARKIYKGKYFVDGIDQFNFVEAGKTRIVMAGQENAVLYDIQWTEADRDAVQEITFYYRDEDLEVKFVGGVFMGEVKDIYNANPFSHRRMSLLGDEWKMVPIYPFAKSGFEPIDPTGRFFYYKSGAFKLYWDDATQNEIHKMFIDATKLDTIKPIIGTGIMKVDSTVIAPGAYITTPNAAASLTPWSSNPNLKAAFDALSKQEADQSESTQDKIMNGVTDPNVTATASIQAMQQAKVFLGVFGNMIADLIMQVGQLTMDCIIQHETNGELDATISDSLRLKQKVFMSKTKEHGKDMTNRIIFSDELLGKKYTPEQINKKEWELWKKAGGYNSDQVIYQVNPYRFARTQFAFYLDADDIVEHAMGNDKQRKLQGFQMLTNPVVSPYVDMKNVIDDFIIDEFSDSSDPDRYKAKGNVNDLMGAIMGGNKGGANGMSPNGGTPEKPAAPSAQGKAQAGIIG